MSPRIALRRLARFEGWSAMRHRNYRLFFAGQGLSLIGTWMMTVAQSWLILQLTGDPLLLGLVAAVQWLPVLVLGLFGGLIADALPKRRTMVFTQGFAMLLSLTMAILVLTNLVQVWHVIAIAFLLGIRNSVDLPARQSFAVEMVGREDVGNAVALNSAMFNGARVIGPAIAGITIGAFGVGIAFLVDAVSYLAVIVALLSMRDADLHTRPGMERPATVRAALGNLAEGIRYVRRTRAVVLSILTVGLVSTFGMNFTVVIPPFVQEVLGGDATAYGFLMAATGVGSIFSALSIAFSGRTMPLVIGVGGATLGLALVLLASTSSMPVALVAMFIAGLGSIAMAATANTLVQLTVPDQLRGRVMSVYTTVFAGSTPFGGLFAGALASGFGAATAILAGGALSVATGLAAAFTIRGRTIRARRAATTVRGAGGEPIEVGPTGLSRVRPR
ncbi:MAG TPA: MFS transporter [Candidatus Limnocylindria bacterium]|nr:MFS transporter [Candidatus Limnocylindria bacterium]